MSKKRLVKISQRVVAFIVSFALVLGGIPLTAKANASNTNGKVTDPSTIHQWQNWFTGDSTEFAGGVWTDKSVFESVDEFETALGNSTMDIKMKSEDNFLVSLSALASNKEIVGYSTIPTDTILILDVSQSMDNSRSIPQMVASANAAIGDLLKLNKNNRVGIVLYSGNSQNGTSSTNTGTLLLELGRYTPNGQNQYISYTGTSDTTVSLADGIRVEGSSQNMSTWGKSKNTIGGTYIQNGLDIAMEEFLDADTVIDSDNVQGGTTRMPILVLMSDGAPTTGTPNYTNIGTSSVGYGGTTSAGLGFMTQLTAAYARAQVEKHYDTEAKFYTLGLNLSEQDNDGQYVASSVLDPENSLSAITTYWNNLFTNGSVGFYSPSATADRYGNFNDVWVTVNRNTNDGLTVDSQHYVDEYFAASGDDGLEAAFTDIVNEIILQSAYYPTLIEGEGNTELDGYITFEDEIGQFMEVKNITGLMLGDNQLFTGGALTKMMGSSEFGDRYTYTELGWELVESVAERIGVSQDVAIEILKDAWADGQLSYVNDDNFSNYIGWYESEDGQYVAYWNESHTEDDIPATAKYITRSYGFYGTANVGAIESLGSDMMHIVVKVRTDIATRQQDVVFMIPAALIPVITYHVELDTDSYETAEEIKMYTDGESPIRLLFEVGLRSDINELNIDEVLAEENLAEGQHIHKNADGTYYFYTNQWGDGDDETGIDYSNPGAHLVTETHFHPNEANERYYYTTDTLIYRNTGTTQNPVYTEYTGTTAPTGTGFYHARRVFEVTNAITGRAVMKDSFIPISANVLADSNKVKRQDGNWYVAAGTIHQEVERFQERTLKEENNTETLDYYAYHAVESPGVGSDEYDVWAYLGNNGRLTVTPATGIKLTKHVDSTVTDANAIFEFTIELTGGDYDGTYRFVDANGTYGTITFTNGKSSSIQMKANETVYIIDLPVGATYTITENNNNTKYKVGNVLQNGVALTGVTATGTIASMSLVDVEFTNTARQYGDLIISKTITHDFGTNYTIPTDRKFDVEVTLGLANGTQVQTSAGVKTVTNGKVTFQLAHNESVTIRNLLEGTIYAVAEVNIPEGFALVTATADRAGVIEGNQRAVVNLVNDYTPTGDVPAISVDVTKELKDVDGNPIEWNNREYKFYLEKWNGTAWERVTNTVAVANGSNPTFTVQVPEGNLTEVGTYVFRVHEDESNLEEGIVSDTAIYFVVVVTDKDMDGSLEVDEIRVDGTPVANINDVNMTFTNTYIVTGGLVVPIPIKKVLENNTGVTLLPSGFEFALYEGNTQVGEIATSNANGDATIYVSYTSEWFNSQTKNGAGNVEKAYTLRELEGNKPGMTYTDKTYEVKVEIGINGTALELVNMSIDGVTENPMAEFTNTYELDPATFTIVGTKTLTGRLIGNDKYTFKMYKTGSDFNVEAGTEVSSVQNNGNTFTLTDTVATAGVHYYVIEEVKGDIPGVTYDTTQYHVTVIARDNNDGKLAIANNNIYIVKVGEGTVNSVAFTNEYKVNPTSIVLTGAKVLEGGNLEHNMFEFVLKEGTREVSRAWSSATGTITFPEITYTEAGTHVYTVTEVNAGRTGYTYDDSSFKVTVEVTDDGLGQLEADVIGVVETDGADEENITDTAVIFRNSYTPNPVTITLEAVKLLENRHLANNEFTFQLFEADSDFNYGTTPVATAHNNAAGQIKFDYQISSADIYYFVMKEDTSNPKEDIVYDEIEYDVTVIVFDQGGYLSYRATYAVDGRDINNVVFSNVFVPQDPVQKDVYAKGDMDISIDGNAVKVGDVLTYEITYTNFTNVVQNDLIIMDVIPEETTYVDGSASTEGFVSYEDGMLTWEFDSVEAGEVVVVTFDVKVDEANAVIENQGQVEVGDNEYVTNVVTNYTFGKEVDKAEGIVGEELVYTITYKNTESETADVTIVDKLVPGLTYVKDSATDNGVYDEATHTITWVIENVAAKADGEVSFKALINEKAVEVINNVATIQVGNNPEISTETDTVETEVLVPELTIEKKQALNNGDPTTSLLQVKTGDKVTYYITVTNIGNLAATGVTITDKIPAGLVIDEGSISNSGVLKDGMIVWTVDELKVNESITVSFTVSVTEYEKEMKFVNMAQTTYENDPTEPEVPQNSNEVVSEYEPVKAPQTGDNTSIAVWSVLAFGSLVVCGFLLIYEKRRRDAL